MIDIIEKWPIKYSKPLSDPITIRDKNYANMIKNLNE